MIISSEYKAKKMFSRVLSNGVGSLVGSCSIIVKELITITIIVAFSKIFEFWIAWASKWMIMRILFKVFLRPRRGNLSRYTSSFSSESF